MVSDPQKRAVYDQYGEEGLKGVPPPGATGGVPGGGATFFTTGGGPSGYRFNPRSPDDIFSELFGFPGPFGGVGSGGMRGSGFGNMFGSPFGEGGGAGGSVHQPALKKASPIEKSLPCTLEELYMGTTKKMKISREIIDANG